MAQLLDHEIIDLGYVEKKPYSTKQLEESKYWIIGAVLGPLIFLVSIFWIVAYIYFKCINPKRSNDKKIAKRLTEESSNSVCEKCIYYFIIVVNVKNIIRFRICFQNKGKNYI